MQKHIVRHILLNSIEFMNSSFLTAEGPVTMCKDNCQVTFARQQVVSNQETH